MNKIALGYKARGAYYESQGKFDLATESYLKCTELPDVWRALALSYSDLDDLENALQAFEQAVASGDLKALPWLVELLQANRPQDPQLHQLKERLDDGLKAGNIDLIFSTGNLHLIGEEFEEAVTYWAPYINSDYWIINRNVANLMLTRYSQLGDLVPPPYGPIDSQEAAIDFFMKVNEKGFKEGLISGLVEIGLRYAENPDLEIFKEYSPIDFFDAFMDSANQGHEEAILLAVNFASFFKDQIPDDSELMKLVEDYGLTDLLEVMNYRRGLEAFKQIVSNNYGSRNNTSRTSDAIQAIFDRADAAKNKGDAFGEISAWVEGIELGDENCFYNLGVALCAELGIVQSFFGAQGGEDKAWSALAKGIGASEHRPGRGPIHTMTRVLSANQVNYVRSTYGGMPIVSGEALKPGHESSIIKMKDLFEKCGFIYNQVDENLISLPFSSVNGGFVIFCELIEDDGKDLALIYTSLLTSQFDGKGVPKTKIDGLNRVQSRVLEILVRNQEVIFPGMAMMDLGTIFNSLPKGSEPNSFLNVTTSKEYWSLIGSSPAAMFCEALPTKHEFEKVEFGYGVDFSLQSDHFESAVRGIAGSITGMLDLISSMYTESPEIFDLIFDYQTPPRFDFNTNLVEYSELAKKGSRTAQAIMVYEESNHDKRLQKLVALSESGMRVANRVMLDTIEITKSNIDQVARCMLKDAELEENNSQVRDALNNIGWKYNEFGQKEKAIEAYTRSAQLGCGNALSNITWEYLTTGQHEEARRIFDECYYRVMTTRDTENDYEQGGNCRSNDALHRLALGASHDELREIWEDAHFQENHLESRFYPIVLDHLEGNAEKVKSRIALLNKNERTELVEIFQTLVNQHEWIAGIAKTSLELLGEEPQKKKGLFRR